MSFRPGQKPYVLGAGVGLIAGVCGMAWRDAALLGLAVMVVVLVSTTPAATSPEHRWPDTTSEETDGARRDVTSLTWSLVGMDGRVSEQAVRRLRADATRRLARRGVVLPGGLNATTSATAPTEAVRRARDLLGERAWRILTVPDGRMPSLDDVAYCVDVIECLVPDRSEPA